MAKAEKLAWYGLVAGWESHLRVGVRARYVMPIHRIAEAECICLQDPTDVARRPGKSEFGGSHRCGKARRGGSHGGGLDLGRREALPDLVGRRQDVEIRGAVAEA